MSFIDDVRKLPRALSPNDDPTSLKSNLTLERKQLILNLMAHAFGRYSRKPVHGYPILKKLKLTEAHVYKRTMGGEPQLISGDETEDSLRSIPLEVQITYDVTVDEDMINIHHSLAGPCSAMITEAATFGPMLIIGLLTGFNAEGVSSNMHLEFYSAAPLGTPLRIVGTSVGISGKMMTSRCEFYDRTTSRLLLSAVHTTKTHSGTLPPVAQAQL